MTEQVKSAKYRTMADLANLVWNRISFWRLASSVEFNSGKNAQTTLGSISGITSSLTSTSTTTVATAYAVKQLNDKIIELQS